MKSLALIVASFVLVGCANTQLLRVDEQAREAKQTSQVQLFLEKPRGEYTSIALIEVSDSGWGITLEKLKAKLIQEAAKLGGDAVIIGELSRTGGSQGEGFLGKERKLTGKVIVFDGPRIAEKPAID